jgi:hypothetical protein
MEGAGRAQGGNVATGQVDTKVRCYACGALGHIGRDCRNRERFMSGNDAGNFGWVQRRSPSTPTRRY